MDKTDWQMFLAVAEAIVIFGFAAATFLLLSKENFDSAIVTGAIVGTLFLHMMR